MGTLKTLTVQSMPSFSDNASVRPGSSKLPIFEFEIGSTQVLGRGRETFALPWVWDSSAPTMISRE